MLIWQITQEKEKIDPVVTTRATALSKDSLKKVESEGLPFRLYVPNDYDGDTYHYPLFIFLHGAGERGNNNISQLQNMVQKHIR